jgi:hypothetical protein
MDLKKAARQAYINSLTQDLTDWDKLELQLQEIEELTAELQQRSEDLLRLTEAFKKGLDSAE